MLSLKTASDNTDKIPNPENGAGSAGLGFFIVSGVIWNNPTPSGLRFYAFIGLI
jgi:hypothetical protein